MNTTSPTRNKKHLENIFNDWIQPHSSITDPIEQHHYRFTLSLFLSFIVMLSAILLFYLVIGITDPILIISAGVLLVTVMISYGITRTAYYRYPPYIACITLHLVFWYVLFSVSENAVLGILFTSAFIIPLTNLYLGTFPTIISTITNIIVVTIFAITHDLAFETTLLIAFNLLNINIALIIRDHYAQVLENSRRIVLEEAVMLSEKNRQATEQVNQELQRASKLIEDNLRLRNEFMASMSHELRTPLNAIGGFCGIMLNGMGGEIDKDARHMIARIEENGTRLLMLINDVLDLTRIEAGRIQLQIYPFEIRKLADKWREKMSPFALEKGLDFEIAVDDDMPEFLVGDTERITQVVTHLLSNAFKFTSEGSIGVNIRPAKDQQFEIEVRDTGIGITSDTEVFIFDKFRQLDNSSTREYGGLGLGLAIVRHLADILQGTVSVSSNPDIQGSIFTFTLPMQIEQITTHESIQQI